ncbi:Virulence sensor protein BvgS [BD1-7 clade bacterium]|uniref:histidine kinase n=1 Tax=BD1-7 clade bacterium TaxID=2029982 RepID=A0A5S9NX34_9GAMM|nr:Virulence sensor protein BvgS [BD1-7 clade bacterium]CAA0110464.1 Virulence sensor protein BvgS [BD1-7 clade bacterium]
MSVADDLSLPIDIQLRCARIEAIKNLLGEHAAGSALLSVVLFLVCRNPVNEVSGLWWLVSQLACLLLYVPCHFVLRRKNSPQSLSLKFWLSYGVVIAVGLSWFAFPFLMLADTDMLMLMVITISICIAPFTTAPTVTLVSFAGFAVYAGLMYLGLVLAVLKHTTIPTVIVTGFMSLLYGFLLLQSYRINARMLGSFRSRIESQLAFAAAEKANREKSTFIASASHDIRQPLQACMFIVDHLYRKAPESLLPIIDNLDQSVGTMRELLDGLLDISRLDAGVLECVPVYVDIRQVLAEVVDGFSERALQENKPLILDIGSYIVYTDPTLLKRILFNLVDNALKYSPSGSPVLVSTRVDGECISITVQDHGVGISSDSQKLIFDEFYQVENPERDHTKGLGLGLAIVRRLTHMLDVEISVESSESMGTAMTLSMRHFQTKSADLAMVERDNIDVDFTGLRVLLIEDQILVRDSLTQLLESWQCVVLTAESVESAVDVVTADGIAIDLIISDYRLRGGSTGAQAIAAINDISEYPIQSIVITGESNTDELRDAEAIADILMFKPLEPGELRSAISRLLDA